MAKIWNTTNFETEVLKSDKPVLVDFWATWCGPCQRQTPIIEELSVGKLDVDENPSIAQQYGVMSIPTLIVFKDGKEAARLVGLQSKDKLVQTLNQF